MPLDAHTFGQVNSFDIEVQLMADIQEFFENIAEILDSCKVDLKNETHFSELSCKSNRSHTNRLQIS